MLEENNDGTIIRSVEKACCIINAIAENGELSVKEISTISGYNISTCYHILNTLVLNRFVSKDKQNNTYSLGSKIAVLYSKMLHSDSLLRLCRPYLRELNERTQETAFFVKFEQNGAVILDYIDSPQALKVSGFQRGYRKDEHARAAGKVYLAFLDEAKLEHYLATQPLRALTPRTNTCRDALKKELLEVRKNGYAIDVEETQQGVIGLSTPIFNCSGEAIGSFSVAYPSNRNTVMTSLLSILREQSVAFSMRLGYSTE